MSTLLRWIGRVVKWAIVAAVALTAVVAVIAFFAIRAFITPPIDDFGNVKDEALLAERTVDSLPGADEPYFAEMDKGVLAKPADGADYPPEIVQVAKDLGLEVQFVNVDALGELIPAPSTRGS